MSEQLLEEALEVQRVIYDRDIPDEDKHEAFLRFLADGSKVRQVALLNVLYATKTHPEPELHKKAFKFIMHLQKKGALPWDLQELNSFCRCKPMRFSETIRDKCFSLMTNTDERYKSLVASATMIVMEDDVEALEKLLATRCLE